MTNKLGWYHLPITLKHISITSMFFYFSMIFKHELKTKMTINKPLKGLTVDYSIKIL